MQATWTNDKLNLLKIQALDELAHASISCGAIWYVTEMPRKMPHLLTNSGKATFRALFDTLPAFIKAFEQSGLIKESFVKEIPNKSKRQDWFQKGLKRMNSCAAVFLDPDTGLNYGHRPKKKEKFVEIGEVVLAAESHCVLIYHHCSRWEGEIRKQSKKIRSALKEGGISSKRIKIKRCKKDKAFLILIEGLMQHWPKDYLKDWTEL